MIDAIAKFLDEPNPINTSYRRALWSALAISCFVALFLMAFQPFGLHEIDKPRRLLLIATYGLPCFPPVLVFNLGMAFACRRTTLGERWKVRHALGASFCILLLVGASNYFHTMLIFNRAFSRDGLLEMEFYTALVGIFPALGNLVWSHMALIRKHQALASSMNRSIDAAAPEAAKPARILTLRAENQSETFTFDAERLCYLKAEGNYVELALCQGREGPETQLLRLTLKDAQAQLAEQGCDVVRCHRSYLVNRGRIASAGGNAQGLILHLDRDRLRVPVSRSYVSLFR